MRSKQPVMFLKCGEPDTLVGRVTYLVSIKIKAPVRTNDIGASLSRVIWRKHHANEPKEQSREHVGTLKSREFIFPKRIHKPITQIRQVYKI